MTQQEKDEQIAKLKDRIADLKQIAGQDIGASYKEATQTQQMLQETEKRLDYLEQTEIGGEEKAYTLQDQQGASITYFVVTSQPDPFVKKISQESTIGKLLLASKVGDKIPIGETIYTIHNIS